MSPQTLRVGVVDTGVDLELPALRGLSGVICQPGGNEGEWGSIGGASLNHGNAVTSLLLAKVGTEEKRWITMLVSAPLGERGGTPDDVLASLEWMASKRVDVVVMAFAAQTGDDRIEVLLARLTRAGVIVLASAGNPRAGQQGAEFPARCEGVVSVGIRSRASIYRTWEHPPDVLVEEPALEAEVAGSLGGTSAAVAMHAGRVTQRLLTEVHDSRTDSMPRTRLARNAIVRTADL